MRQAVLRQMAAEETIVKSIQVDLDPAKILVVEDDEEMRVFLEESLEEEGYAVRTAPNTLSALVALMSEKADVLVVDWKMPDLDGFALLAAVRRSGVDVPVIFVTAFPRPEVERRARDEGVFSFLPKPFRLSHLVSEIERAIKGRPAPERGGARADRRRERRESAVAPEERIP